MSRKGAFLVGQQKMSGTRIELTGNRSAVVDGCDGIVDYDDEKVIVRTGRLTVRFLGRDLKLMRLTGDSAVIRGVIHSVEYNY